MTAKRTELGAGTPSRCPVPASVIPPPSAERELPLLAAACHELRPAVTHLRVLTRTLRDGADRLPDAQRYELADLAYDLSQHLMEVIDQVGTDAIGQVGTEVIGRVRTEVIGQVRPAGAGEPDDEAVGRAQQPVARILPMVTAMVPGERLRLHVEPMVRWRQVHAQHFRQILINLLDNAVRHGRRDGPVRLSVATRTDGLVLIVANEIVPRESHGVASHPTPGHRRAGQAGLGLRIVRHLVALEGGTMTAYELWPSHVVVQVLLPNPA